MDWDIEEELLAQYGGRVAPPHVESQTTSEPYRVKPTPVATVHPIQKRPGFFKRLLFGKAA